MTTDTMYADGRIDGFFEAISAIMDAAGPEMRKRILEQVIRMYENEEGDA